MGFTKILALLIAASSASAFAQKKVLFLDLNDGKKEIAEAKKMTKTKGDQLTVFPGAGEFDKEKLKELMKGQKFDSIVISGHNGGSSYSGTKGNVEVGELLSIMEETQNDQVQSLYLLGCNTANKSKIYFWKEALPNLKFIAGYDGTAPSSERLAGLKYFSDTYAKEDDLISTTDPAKLKAALQKVQYIFDLEASVYVSCQEDSEYHWLSQRDAKDRFSELSTAECGARIKEYKDLYLEKIRQYWEGVLEPTAEDTRTGFLRKAYTFTRQNEHCLGVKDGGLLDFAASGDAMLFLLFNKDFNRSFLEYYDPLLGETLDTLTALETDEDAYF